MDTDAFLHHVVKLANKTAKRLTGSFSEVQAIVDGSEIVVAVWQDFSEPKGVGTLLIKGHQNLRELLSDGEIAVRQVAAIPCVSSDQAWALKMAAGEQDWHH